MEKNNKVSFDVIFLIISILILPIIFYFTKDKSYLKLLVIIIIFIVFIFTISCIMEFKWYLERKRENKHIESLKSKENKTVFDKLYLQIYSEKFDNNFKRLLDQKNIKEIRSLYSYEKDINTLKINFNYKGFDIDLFIEENNAYYLIDTPSKYDVLEENEKFENEKKEILSSLNFNTLDEYINYLVDSINKIKEEVDIFSKIYTVDNVFNGRLKKRINAFTTYCNKGTVIIALGIIVLIMFIILTLCLAFDSEFKDDHLALYIIVALICVASIAFCIAYIIIGIKYHKLSKIIDKDFIEQNTSIIKGNPYKVKVGKMLRSKYSDAYELIYLKLFIDDSILYIPFSNETIKNKKNIKKVCEECKNINVELTYLLESKVVIDGEKPYVKIIEKYLLNGKRK